MFDTAEDRRIALGVAREANWQRWGTYLPERQWGTVREDYSADGDSWASFPYEMGAYRAYRWGEDGLLGWTDRECRLCFSTSLWNGADEHLKERLFGLTNGEGNHGEDVKELYYYLDATPTGSYAKALYKYPQKAFPYDDLRATNKARGLKKHEYELLDTGIFKENRYFDVTIEYAKRDVEDMLIRITATNRAAVEARLVLLPTLTLRNKWSWRPQAEHDAQRASMTDRGDHVEVREATLGEFRFELCSAELGERKAAPEIAFTDNETNFARWKGHKDGSPEGIAYTKDAFDRYVVHGEDEAVNAAGTGTKCAYVLRSTVAAGASEVITLRLVRTDQAAAAPLTEAEIDAVFADRKREADEFYAARLSPKLTDDDRNIARQAYAGLLWSKQFYNYVAEQWMAGDPGQPAPPEERKSGRNAGWANLYCKDVLSVPDKWEYPWFAAWDTAFHVVAMADLDSEYAKAQLMLLLREWYLNPNGQLPAYEYAFSDANPPVHAWAVLHVYRKERLQRDGKGDTDFLERCFQKLLLNFTWWVNREDANGRNLFGGGFLGLDNIGVFDRSMLMEGQRLEQADGTAWMGLYCASMLKLALELAQTRPVYEDIATKFLEHYVAIVEAINHHGGNGLWDDEIGFYFDRLRTGDGKSQDLMIRSVVGLVPLFGVAVIDHGHLERVPDFRRRLDWFLKHKPMLGRHVLGVETKDPDHTGDLYLSIVPKDRLSRLLRYAFDEAEFLSPWGVRSLSRFHEDEPYMLKTGGKKYEVQYLPGESDSRLFGGNSNWRGPVWMPMNILFRDAMDQYGVAFGGEYTVEYPAGSGQMHTFAEVAEDVDARLLRMFRRDEHGMRPTHGDEACYRDDPHWRDLLLFSEYFCGDTGRGLGASHQTGWTALIAGSIRRSER